MAWRRCRHLKQERAALPGGPQRQGFDRLTTGLADLPRPRSFLLIRRGVLLRLLPLFLLLFLVLERVSEPGEVLERLVPEGCAKRQQDDGHSDPDPVHGVLVEGPALREERDIHESEPPLKVLEPLQSLVDSTLAEPLQSLLVGREDLLPFRMNLERDGHPRFRLAIRNPAG